MDPDKDPVRSLFTPGGFLAPCRRQVEVVRTRTASGWGSRYNAPEEDIVPRLRSPPRLQPPPVLPLSLSRGGDAPPPEPVPGAGVHAHSVRAYNSIHPRSAIATLTSAGALVGHPIPPLASPGRLPQRPASAVPARPVPEYAAWVAASGAPRRGPGAKALTSAQQRTLYEVPTRHRLKASFKRHAYVDGVSMQELLGPNVRPRSASDSRRPPAPAPMVTACLPRALAQRRAPPPPAAAPPPAPPPAPEEPRPAPEEPRPAREPRPAAAGPPLPRVASAKRGSAEGAMPRLRVNMRWVRAPKPDRSPVDIFRSINALQLHGRLAKVSCGPGPARKQPPPPAEPPAPPTLAAEPA
eukprot:TRINITY_DN35376_c0_g3_i1.p2 TRINITY_DN35376_c0_g3~~TRINITY_DN35376_c0_g3_i1.p2  ORF type:complete len:378 (+),score=108.43 TRINITY_DN35376_c0_g3_i1:76-1134(+)